MTGPHHVQASPRPGRRACLACLALVVCAASWSPARASADEGPFDQGKSRVSLGLSTNVEFNTRYIVFHLGYGFFLLDGWEIGLDSQIWVGTGPFVAQISPQTRYVFDLHPRFAPYVGPFYRHWFIGGGRDDIDSVGGRIGFFSSAGAGGALNFGLGLAYEYVLGCQQNCGILYPELQVSLSL
jgi:hypothetical protein